MLLMVLVLPLRDGAARVASHADGRELGRDRHAGPTARAARNPHLARTGRSRSAWVAKLLASIRERANQHSILYDGHYARRTRKHTRKKRPAANYDELNATQRRTLRRRWANLIRRVFKTDPLICKNCGGKMRVVSFMSEPSVICQILDHLENRNSRDPPLSSATLPRA